MIYNQDIMEWCKSYKGEKFHAILCDPPYELGFLGKEWDKSGIAFNPETWKALKEHLHDGGFGMAFASSRGWHRMAVAIEDAGFIIHPTIFGWAFGSGFPKATRIDHQVEALIKLGKTNPQAMRQIRMGNDYKPTGQKDYKLGRKFSNEIENDDHNPELSDEAKRWAGHRYGLQAIKPALEPIIVFQKPYKGKPIQNIMETGAGALNIDGCRLTPDNVNQPIRKRKASSEFGQNSNWNDHNNINTEYDPNQGRWPANFIILDDQAKEALDRQSGVLKSGDNCIRTKSGEGYHGNIGKAGDIQISYGDSGGASRFFFNVQNQIDEADPVYYCAKASKSERNAGLKEMPDKEWHLNHLEGGDRLGLQGSIKGVNKNNHPTIKPLSLTKYLATLLLPPEGYHRRILIPFAGVGSEMIGAMQAGWDEIIGIELSEEYIPIAEARLKYWKNKKEHKVQKMGKDDQQLEMQMELL